MSKRLVKNELRPIDWQVLKYLKKWGLGKRQAIKGRELADLFSNQYNNTQEIRAIIKRLRTSPQVDVVIGSCSKGYYIPLTVEHEEAVALMLSKTLSQVETVVNMYPQGANVIYKVLNEITKSVSKVFDGQTQMQFNGWENDIIKLYAERYQKDTNCLENKEKELEK